MAGSLTTTTFTGVQIGSDQAYDTRNVLDLATQNASLLLDGGSLSLGEGTMTKSVDTVGSATSITVTADEVSLVSHSANSIVLAYRSGNTVYYWFNTGANL